MQEWFSLHYEWLRAGHIIAVIAWMAGMLYLPRLFVYHAMEESGSDTSQTFKVMERRLLRFIMTPAMGFMNTLNTEFNGEAYGFAHMQPDARTADALAAPQICAALDNHFLPKNEHSVKSTFTNG